MKKLLAAIFLLIFAISAYAKEITYFTLTGKIYNSIFKQLDKRAVKLDYDTDYDSVILYYSGYIYDIAIEINKENRTNLMRQMEKYMEWNRKAIRKGIKLERIIGSIVTRVFFDEYGYGWKVDSDVIIWTDFFSQTASRHQFVLVTSRLVDDNNELLTAKPDALYFDYDEVKELMKGLDEEFIQDKVKEILDRERMINEEFK